MTEEFRSYKSYWDFQYSVKQWRYLRSPEDEEFLRTVASTAEKKIEELPEGATLWRAQAAHGSINALHDVVEVPADADRMKPPPDWWTVGRSNEGRINPKGIPALYASTAADIDSAKKLAISEVRPEPGSFVTVAELRTNRSLRIVNATTDEVKIRNIIYFAEPSGSEREVAVWREIDRALSVPIEKSDDRADYAPTQIIAELFRKKGLDGIGYRSSFGPGHNVALFDIFAADVGERTLYRVTAVDTTYSQVGNPTIAD
jgi:hypothetical protein